MSPIVSVILPVYNGAHYLIEALESVLTQSFHDYELIVVDDGSTDDSRAIVHNYLSSYPQLRYLYQKNAGVTTARNSGFLSSRGSLISFIDQDDRWRVNALQCQAACHLQYPETGYTLAHQICFLDAEDSSPAWFQLQQLDKQHVGYLPGTLMVKREVFSDLGMFDPYYTISSDADWFARARDLHIPMHILPEVLLERRIHSENQSKHSREIQSELTRILRNSIKRKRRMRREPHSD